MKIAMPQYEFRYHGETVWKEISEIELLQRLLEDYDRVTPAIQTMLEGGQLLAADGVYRLKSQGNVQFIK